MRTEYTLGNFRIHFESRARRRWLVLVFCLSMSALVAAWLFLKGHPMLSWVAPALCVFGARLLGGRWGGGYAILKPFDSGDEREIRRSEHAHYLAYKYLDAVFLPALLAVVFKEQPYVHAWAPVIRNIFDVLPWALLIAAFIAYYTLPQAILLWTEPDMEGQQ